MKRTFNIKSDIGNKAAHAFIDEIRAHESNVIRVSIEKLSERRTSIQNAALHLYFTHCATALNEHGLYFVWHGLNGHELNCEWDGNLFKERVWKPLQKTKFGIDSTTKINTKQINEIIDILTNWFAEKQIQVNFPSQFELYIQQIKADNCCLRI